MTIPAGWYPDPAGSAGTRWWNGAAWTHAVQAPIAPVAPVAQPGTAQPGTAQPGTAIASGDGAYIPFQSEVHRGASVKRSLTYTRSIWWISGQPIWAIVPQIALVGPNPPLSLTIGLALLNLAIWVALIALASADRTALLAGGNQSAASPLWMLLSPLVYMIVRSIEVRRWDASGWVPLIWWILAAIVSPVLGVVGVFAVFGILPF